MYRLPEIIALAAVLLSFAIPAKADWNTDVILKSRLSAEADNGDFKFNCDFLRLQVKGTFADNFSYNFRQRLNKAPTKENFLGATDYLYLNWKKNNWEIGGGKFCIACGGIEYNSSSYDLYIRPEFFNSLGGMYNYVLDGAWHHGGERFCLQFCNSLYRTSASDLFGYSFNVSGRQGVWEHKYSVNFFERSKGNFDQFVCLGNRFNMDRVVWTLELTHRLDMARPTFFKDFSAVTKCKAEVLPWMNVFAKATWDYKEDVADPMLPDGTNVCQAGAGFEFYPVKKYRNLRLHAVYWNRNGNMNCVQAGLSWQLDIFRSESRGKKQLRCD